MGLWLVLVASLAIICASAVQERDKSIYACTDSKFLSQGLFSIKIKYIVIEEVCVPLDLLL